jgi:IclR family transcriptional regulator, pca regulon regulatory protein
MSNGTARPNNQARMTGEFSHFEGDPDFALTLARGLLVVESFIASEKGLSVSEVAERIGISRAAVRRILMTLQSLGYAESDGRLYRLKIRVLRLALGYQASSTLSTLAQPLLERITETVHESASLSVLDGDQVVYIARSAVKRVMSINLAPWSRLPAYCTSLGRVLLAALPEADFEKCLAGMELRKLTPKTVCEKSKLRDVVQKVKRNGYAIVDQELEVGLRSIAVPVKTPAGRVVAAMNVGLNPQRAPLSEMTSRFLPLLRETASALGAFLK